MKRLIFTFFTAFILMACDNTNTSKTVVTNTLTENEVRNFVSAYDQMWEDRDTTAIKNAIDMKYSYFSSTGDTSNLSNMISWFTPADKYKVDTAIRSEISVKVIGNIAIVNSRWIGKGSFGSEKFNDDQRCGLVIQKQDGQLKLVSEHCVQIKKEAL